MNHYEETIFAYIIYALSAYVVCILVFHMIYYRKKFKDKLLNNKLMNTSFMKKYRSDFEFRKEVSLYNGCFMNCFYFIFKFILGLVYHSTWLFAIAIYYLVLSMIRMNLVRVHRKTSKMSDLKESMFSQLINAKRTGYLMLLLNLAMSGMVIQMIWENRFYKYPGFIIYVMALYTFYSLISLCINAIRFRKLNLPLISTSTIVSLSGAFMSIFALQTAMFQEFGNDEMLAFIMNICTGSCVMIFVFMLAIYLIRISKKEMKRL